MVRIPCDTLSRLSHLLGDEPPFNAFRLDNGKVIASNRSFLAVEQVEPFQGVFYIAGNADLVERCRTEAEYSSVIEFTPVPSLRYTTAITTLGTRISENIGVWPDDGTVFDEWYASVVEPCLTPVEQSTGPMSFNASLLGALAAAAPSGNLVLETNADPERRPTVVRDADSADWVGFFRAHLDDGRHKVSATVPGWCR